MLMGNACLCTQESFLVVFRGPDGRIRIEPVSVECKANTLLNVLLFQPNLGCSSVLGFVQHFFLRP